MPRPVLIAILAAATFGFPVVALEPAIARNAEQHVSVPDETASPPGAAAPAVVASASAVAAPVAAAPALAAHAVVAAAPVAGRARGAAVPLASSSARTLVVAAR